jgi:hypothetical protein
MRDRGERATPALACAVDCPIRGDDEIMCDHDWQPIPNWYARYRCSICRVIGGKFGVICAHHGVRNVAIQPYRCGASRGGVKCPKPAVHSDRGKSFRCAEHVRRERTPAARQQLASAKATEAMKVEAPESSRPDCHSMSTPKEAQ